MCLCRSFQCVETVLFMSTQVSVVERGLGGGGVRCVSVWVRDQGAEGSEG